VTIPAIAVRLSRGTAPDAWCAIRNVWFQKNRHVDASCEAVLHRLPVQDQFTQGKLQVGRKDWPATLVNESAGGFLLFTSPETKLSPGDSATIELYSGSYLVEIVHTRMEDGQLHLGARRFDDELQPRPRVAVHRGWGKGGVQRPPRSLHGVLFFGAYAAITVLALVLVMGGKDGQLAKTLLGTERAERASAFSSLPTTFDGQMDWNRAQSLHGINSLASDQIRAAIGLTADQQQSLNRVFGDTSRRLQALFADESHAPEETTRKSSEIIDLAVQRVLCTLTDRQIERWRQELILAAASPQNK
jgi:hypothetical protein